MKKNYPLFLKKDYDMHSFLRKRLSLTSFSKTFIERAGQPGDVKISRLVRGLSLVVRSRISRFSAVI
jgi:ribosomal protein S3